MTSSGFSPWAIKTTPPVTSLPSFSSTPRRKPGPSRDIRDLGEPDRASLGKRHDHVFQVARGRDSESKLSSPGVGDAPSRPTPRTTYSAFPLWTTCPPDEAFDVATASTTSLSDTPKTRSRLGSGTTWYSIGKPADARDLGHAGNRAELGADVPVLDRAEPAQVEARRPRRCTRRSGRSPRRRASARGSAPSGSSACDPSQPLGHAPAPFGEVDAVVEDHADHREADVAR